MTESRVTEEHLLSRRIENSELTSDGFICQMHYEEKEKEKERDKDKRHMNMLHYYKRLQAAG